MRRLIDTPDSDVEAITGRAWEAANDPDSLVDRAKAGRSALRELDGARTGTGGYISAVPTACNEHLPVYGSWTLKSLKYLEKVTEKELSPSYSRYVEIVDKLRRDGGFDSNRAVDLSLYWLMQKDEQV